MFFSSNLYAEEFLGIKLGMTDQEVAAKGKFYGATLYYDQSGGRVNNASLRLDSKPNEILTSITFCDYIVVGVSNGYDIGNDILDKIKNNLLKYGNPTTKIDEQDWTGPGGGTIRTIRHIWRLNNFVSEVTVTPEGRSSDGSLKYRQASHYSISTPNNKCFNRKF
jgi:hypothetical protein